MVILKLIDRIPFFAKFCQEDKLWLAEAGSFFENYEKGDFIIREGEAGDTLLVIIKGSVSVTKNSHPERVLAYLKDGAIFGEISFLTNRSRSTNVIAEERTICFVMNSDTMKGMGHSLQLQFRDQLIDILVKRLDAMNSIIPSMLG